MIFFDLDGTLLDHDFAVSSAINGVLRAVGIQTKYSDEDTFKSWNDFLDIYYTKYLMGELTFEEQRAERLKAFFIQMFDITMTKFEMNNFYEQYFSRYIENWRLYDDVVESLQQLKGIKLGIISNGNYDQQMDKLNSMGIRKYFTTVITSSQIEIAKPDKRIFEHACQEADVSITDCIYVGDRLETDAIASSKAGMTGIWLNRNDTLLDVKNNKELLVINSLRDLSNVSKLLRKKE